MGKIPYRLNETMRKRFLDALRAGCTIKDASAIVRVGRSTVQEWLRCGRLPDASQVLKDFVLDVEEAISQSAVPLVVLIRKHATKNWKAAAWLLATRFPEEWGKKDPERERSDQERLEQVRSIMDQAIQTGVFDGAVSVEMSLDLSSEAASEESAKDTADKAEPAS